jgi:hypothetical protein
MVDPETPNGEIIYIYSSSICILTLLWLDPFDIKTEQEIKEMSEDSRRNYIRRKKAFDIRATARRLLFEGDFDG